MRRRRRGTRRWSPVHGHRSQIGSAEIDFTASRVSWTRMRRNGPMLGGHRPSLYSRSTDSQDTLVLVLNAHSGMATVIYSMSLVTRHFFFFFQRRISPTVHCNKPRFSQRTQFCKFPSTLLLCWRTFDVLLTQPLEGGDLECIGYRGTFLWGFSFRRRLNDVASFQFSEFLNRFRPIVWY